MGAVFLRPNLGDVNPTRPARFRGNYLMRALIDSVDTHDSDYSQPLPPSAWTVNNPTTPSARPCPYVTTYHYHREMESHSHVVIVILGFEYTKHE